MVSGLRDALESMRDTMAATGMVIDAKTVSDLLAVYPAESRQPAISRADLQGWIAELLDAPTPEERDRTEDRLWNALNETARD